VTTPSRAGSGAPSTRDRISEAYEQLRDLIVRGRLAPGSRIIETDVARRLAVSRTPVRSALQRLQQEGYVYAADEGRRTRLTVTPLTGKDARELFAIVGVVEGLAAYWAAEMAWAAREPLVEELRELDDLLLAELEGESPDPNRIFSLYTRFHREYVDAADGPRLLTLHDAVKPQADRYRFLYSSALITRIPESVKEHGEIIRALETGDGERAERAVRTNWRNAAERLGRVIDTLGERGRW